MPGGNVGAAAAAGLVERTRLRVCIRHLAHDRHPATSNNWDSDLELMIWTYNNGQTPRVL